MIGIVHVLRAEVAELVDALGSGSSGRTLVMVQIHSSAPFKKQGFRSLLHMLLNLLLLPSSNGFLTDKKESSKSSICCLVKSVHFPLKLYR